MGKLKKGFTLIEVALFLAITGALFAAVTVGVQHSISQQRFNDAVQSFSEFLRSVYSQTMNVQNLGGGRSDKAIYGRLISFGEKQDLTGASINLNESKNTVFVYDVVGNIDDKALSDNILDSLKELHADVVLVQGGELKPVGIVENYVSKWSSQIEPACADGKCSYDPFVGAILIVRHPSSGTVYTYVEEGEMLDINSKIVKLREDYNYLKPDLNSEDELKRQAAERRLNDYIQGVNGQSILPQLLDKFSMKTLDLCINPEGDLEYSTRRDVRLVKGARNGSGIEILSDEQSNCVVKE